MIMVIEFGLEMMVVYVGGWRVPPKRGHANGKGIMNLRIKQMILDIQLDDKFSHTPVGL
jgi:hypothetical protein